MPVNWCPALGTVLANEEVIDGLSERGGHPVIRKVHTRLMYFHILDHLSYNLLGLIPIIEWFYNFTVSLFIANEAMDAQDYGIC